MVSPSPAPEVQHTPTRGRYVRQASSGTPLVAGMHPAAAEIIPDFSTALTFVSRMCAESETSAWSHPIVGVLLPRRVADSDSQHETEHASLGICAHWHSATQDINFERKLMLRALLSSIPTDFFILPHGCASLEELDLGPLKVQALLEAIAARRRVDFNSAEFRWDVEQPPLNLWWGSGDRGLSTAPWAGLSKRQLDVAAYETLLLVLSDWGSSDSSGGNGSQEAQLLTMEDEAVASCVAAQLGIGSTENERLRRSLRRGLTAAATAGSAPDAGSAADGAAEVAAVDTADASAAAASERCSMRTRLRLLQVTKPADFATDDEFFEWQVRGRCSCPTACAHGMAWHGMAWHGMAWHGMAWRAHAVRRAPVVVAHSSLNGGGGVIGACRSARRRCSASRCMPCSPRTVQSTMTLSSLPPSRCLDRKSVV